MAETASQFAPNPAYVFRMIPEGQTVKDPHIVRRDAELAMVNQTIDLLKEDKLETPILNFTGIHGMGRTVFMGQVEEELQTRKQMYLKINPPRDGESEKPYFSFYDPDHTIGEIRLTEINSKLSTLSSFFELLRVSNKRALESVGPLSQELISDFSELLGDQRIAILYDFDEDPHSRGIDDFGSNIIQAILNKGKATAFISSVGRIGFDVIYSNKRKDVALSAFTAEQTAQQLPEGYKNSAEAINQITGGIPEANHVVAQALPGILDQGTPLDESPILQGKLSDMVVHDYVIPRLFRGLESYKGKDDTLFRAARLICRMRTVGISGHLDEYLNSLEPSTFKNDSFLISSLGALGVVEWKDHPKGYALVTPLKDVLASNVRLDRIAEYKGQLTSSSRMYNEWLQLAKAHPEDDTLTTWGAVGLAEQIYTSYQIIRDDPTHFPEPIPKNLADNLKFILERHFKETDSYMKKKILPKLKTILQEDPEIIGIMDGDVSSLLVEIDNVLNPIPAEKVQ